MDLILLKPGDTDAVFGIKKNDGNSGAILVDNVWRDADALKDLGQSRPPS